MLFSPLVSGSSGNSTFIEAGGARLLVDAGVTAKRVCELLCAVEVAPATIDGILITHEHVDHVAGVAVLARRFNIPVYANADCFAQLALRGVDVSTKNMRVFESDREFYIKNVCVLPFSTPHDSAHAVGFTLSCGGEKCAVMTDVGHVTAHMIDVVAGSDILLLEANHDIDMLKAGSYPFPLKQRILSGTGHLNNEDAGRALVKLFGRGVRNVVLGHLSKENNTPELALVTVQTVLAENGMLDAMHVTIARRDEPTGVYEIA